MASWEAKEILEKQAAESIVYRFDFTDALSSGETLASVSTIIADSTEITLGAAVVSTGTYTRNNGETGSSSTSVTVRVSGGTAGKRYGLECLVVTSSTNIRELDGILVVRD